jgi:hypothetical protein
LSLSGSALCEQVALPSRFRALGQTNRLGSLRAR